MEKKKTIYWIRHGESCANIVRNNSILVHDKQHAHQVESDKINDDDEIPYIQDIKPKDSGFKDIKKDLLNKDNSRLFDQTTYNNMRVDGDKTGEMTSVMYHPPLSSNGINQVIKMTSELPETFKNIDPENVLYVSSATLRTIMTGLIFLKEKIKNNITNSKLLVIYPYINEELSSKVTSVDKDDRKDLKQVQGDFGIPHEIIKDVVKLGINYLLKYTDVFINSNVDDIMKCIDFDIYINHCNSKPELNPYLQNISKFKELLNENNNENKDVVAFVHFKVILKEIKDYVKNAPQNEKPNPDSGDNTSIWKEEMNKEGIIQSFKLLYPGAKTRLFNSFDNRVNSKDKVPEENNTICYMNNDGENEEALIHNVSLLYKDLYTNNTESSINKFNYMSPDNTKISTPKEQNPKEPKEPKPNGGNRRKRRTQKRKYNKKYTKKMYNKNKNKNKNKKNKKSKNKRNKPKRITRRKNN